MTGLVRDHNHQIVEVSDDVLNELAKYDGKCIVIDATGSHTHGEVQWLNGQYVIRLVVSVETPRRVVKIKPRLVTAQEGAQP